MKKVLVFLIVIFFAADVSAAGDAWTRFGIKRVRPYPAPLFTLRAVPGSGNVSLMDFRGKVLVLNFWATWCLPCTMEIPSLEVLNRRFSADGLEVVLINMAEKKETVLDFARKNNFNGLKILMDQSGAAGDSYGIAAIPTTYIVDRGGMVVGGALGFRDWADPSSTEVFRELLKK